VPPKEFSPNHEPVSQVSWLPADQLSANFWNPNVVFGQELRLLLHSILTNGWLHPLIVRSEDYLIIDGYHRWRLSQEKALRTRCGGLVPCVMLDVSLEEAKLITVRINRAKGTHVAVAMSKLVSSLIEEHGLSKERLAKELGASTEEIELLYTDDIFKAKNLKNYRYSPAWEPQYIPEESS